MKPGRVGARYRRNAEAMRPHENGARSMARYFCDLCDGAGGIEDTSGTELLDDRSAVAHGYRVARELMRHNEPQSRKLCIALHADRRKLLFRRPFAAVDETIDCR